MHELLQVYQKNFKKGLLYAVLFHITGGLAWLYWPVLFGNGEVAVRLSPYTEALDLQFNVPDIAPSGPTLLIPEETPAPPDLLGDIIPVPDPLDDDSLMVEMEITEPALITQTVNASAVGAPSGSDISAGGRGSGIASPAPPSRSNRDGAAYDERPRVLRQVEPAYPPLAKLTGIEGLVVLSVLIDETGRLQEVQVVKSLGNTGCDQAAVTAAKQWTFAPAIRQGNPVAARVTLPVLFSLKTAR